MTSGRGFDVGVYLCGPDHASNDTNDNLVRDLRSNRRMTGDMQPKLGYIICWFVNERIAETISRWGIGPGCHAGAHRLSESRGIQSTSAAVNVNALKNGTGQSVVSQHIIYSGLLLASTKYTPASSEHVWVAEPNVEQHMESKQPHEEQSMAIMIQ